MPEIKFTCPGCNVSLKVSDTLAGKKIKCPKCAAIAPVPAASHAAPAKPAAPAPHAAPIRPAAPIKPPPRVAPPPPEPEEEEDPFGHEQESSEYEDAPPSRSRRDEPSPSKRGMFIPLLVTLLVAAYIGGVVCVYLGILLPLPTK